MSSETMAIRGLEMQLNSAYNEIARLRAALQEIADYDGGYDYDAWCIQAQIAQKALMHPKDDVEQRSKLPPNQGQPRHNNKDQ